MRRRLIDDDAHGPFGGMGAHIDYAAGEPVIAHGRHRDQHLSIEVAALGTLALLRFGFAGRWFGDSRRAAIDARDFGFGVGRYVAPRPGLGDRSLADGGSVRIGGG